MKKSVLFLVLTSFIFNACNREKTLFVADHTVDCEGASPQKCLLIRENIREEWQLFYDAIEGFNYEEGFFYELRVTEKKVKNPQADESSLKYTLVKVISKTKEVTSSEKPTTPIKDFEGDWEVVEINNFENKTGRNPYFTIANKKINGDNGCNRFGGEISINNEGVYSLDNMFQTKMFCIETADLEMNFTSALNKIANFKKDNNTLFAFDKEGQMLFKAIPKTMIKTENIVKTSNVNPERKTVEPQKMNYLISYGISTRGYAKEWKFDGRVLNINQTNPEMVQKEIKITEKDRLAIEKLFLELDLNKLETLEPPSTKHQFDGAKHASFTVEVEGNIYRVPTFDHGNPPAYIKNIVEKLDKLASK